MAKLNRDELLRAFVQTLIDGWGPTAVRQTLEELSGAPSTERQRRGVETPQAAVTTASMIVGEANVPVHLKDLLTDLAMRFDSGSAFPTMGDIRSFLVAHQRNGGDLKSRLSGFKRMLPVLTEMSPKGLEKLLSRSHHSGPADLGAIADAIRGTGEALRGRPEDAGPEQKLPEQ